MSLVQVVFERNRTGFEESKDFTPAVDTIIAGRYQVQDYLGTAVFSTAIQCLDLETVTEENPVSRPWLVVHLMEGGQGSSFLLGSRLVWHAPR